MGHARSCAMNQPASIAPVLPGSPPAGLEGIAAGIVKERQISAQHAMSAHRTICPHNKRNWSRPVYRRHSRRVGPQAGSTHRATTLTGPRPDGPAALVCIGGGGTAIRATVRLSPDNWGRIDAARSRPIRHSVRNGRAPAGRPGPLPPRRLNAVRPAPRRTLLAPRTHPRTTVR